MIDPRTRSQVQPAGKTLAGFAWLDCLGIGASGPVEIGSHLRTKILKTGNYDFVKGWNWGDDKPPGLASNPTDQHLRVPGRMKPHSVAVHPSSDQQAAIGWRSPATVKLRVEASVTPGEPECGNGLTWSLELRRGAVRQRLATGLAVGGAEVKVGPIENLSVRPGDLVSLLVGSRDGNQSCDLAVVDFRLTGSGAGAQTWDLAADVSPNVHAGNPHADSFGNEAVWHFYAEPNESVNALVLPPGSLLAKWQSAASAEEKQKLADDLQTLLLSGPPSDKESPDAKLHEQLASFAGPLLPARLPALPQTIAAQPSSPESGWGLDPATFGRHPNGQEIDPASFCVRAPSVIEIRLPADLMAGCELVTTGMLEKTTGTEGSVQLQVLTTRPADDLVQKLVPAVPVVVNDGSAAFKRLESAFDSFRQTFPAALCYTQIVPVDEAVTARLFHRADEQLSRLMLDDAQQAKLDRLWDALHYVSHDAIAVVDALAQLAEYATSVGEFKFLDPLREPTKQRAAEFRQRLIDTQPKHLEALLKFTERAYRRPLTEAEKGELRGLYEKLRAQELAHEDAIRLTLARVLIAPDFLYRAEKPAPGKEQGPVSDLELATRLSYFLWSSAPDAELHASAVAGTLRTPETLLTQTRRMLGDPRARRLATEFACQWLHIHGFDTLDEKSERHFPTFGALRGAMYEESIRFFTDFLQGDRSVLSILDADHTFLNEALAHHYGIPGVAGTEWRRVEGVKKFARGGILGQGAPLAKQSGASRTSPILRGNWVAEVLLGDRLPRPPKGVPPLPEAEATESLTMRQLTEKHTTDPLCYGCHQRIDAFGFTLENFDAIGRHRDRDLGDRPINTRAKVMDGTEIEGIEGLRAYLLTTRRDAFLRQFCRKFLGYALGRSVQLSDEPLLTEMRAQLATNGFRVSTVIEAIVKSRQFLDVRGGEE